MYVWINHFPGRSGDRVEVAPEYDDGGSVDDGWVEGPAWEREAVSASWAIAARDAAMEVGDWPAAARFAGEAREAIRATLAAGADVDELARELDYPGGAAALDGPHIDALIGQHTRNDQDGDVDDAPVADSLDAGGGGVGEPAVRHGMGGGGDGVQPAFLPGEGGRAWQSEAELRAYGAALDRSGIEAVRSAQGKTVDSASASSSDDEPGLYMGMSRGHRDADEESPGDDDERVDDTGSAEDTSDRGDNEGDGL